MPTIDPNDLPKPVAPTSPPVAPPAAATPPSAATPPPPPPPQGPVVDVTPARGSGDGGNGGQGSRMIIIAVAAVAVIVVIIIGAAIAIFAASGSDTADGPTSSPASEIVESGLGYDVTGSDASCLVAKLDEKGIDADAVQNSDDPSGVAESVVDCVSTDELAKVAAAQVSSNFDLDEDCVLEGYEGASESTWSRYLEAIFAGDNNEIGDIEADIYGNCT